MSKPPVISIHGKYNIYDLSRPGKPKFQARVWDAQTKNRSTKSYGTLAAAELWADGQWAKFQLGQENAGSVSISGKKAEYLAFLRGSGRSPAYIQQIDRFLNELTAGGVDNLRKDSVIRDAAAFMLNRKNRTKRDAGTAPDLNPSTKARLVTYLRIFGNWLCHPTRRYLAWNPFRGVPTPRVPRRMLPVFTLTECRKLCTDRALASEEGLHWALRLYTGMRAEEATWLRWEHVMLDQRRLRVKVADDLDTCEAVSMARPGRKNDHIGKTLKGQKERLAILQDELADILLKLKGEPNQYVFSAHLRGRNPTTERRAYAKHLKSLGIPFDKRTPHRLRATCASILLAGGLDVYQLGEHMGHAKMDTTQDYVRSASMFREQCHAWAGKFHFRSPLPCHNRATEPDFMGLDQRDEPSADKSPTGADEELIILLPSTSDLIRMNGRDGQRSDETASDKMPEIIAELNGLNFRSCKPFYDSALCDDEECIPLT